MNIMADAKLEEKKETKDTSSVFQTDSDTEMKLGRGQHN